MLPSPELVLGTLLVLISGLVILISSGFFVFVSPMGIFYGLFVVFIYIGTIFIHYDVTLAYAVPVESHPLILGGAIFLFALGTVVPKYLFGFRSFKETRQYARKRPESWVNDNFQKGVLIIAGILVLWSIVVYLRAGSPLLSPIPYREWVAANRLLMLGVRLFLPLTTILILVYGYAQQESLIWRVGIVALGATFIFMILTSRRYPVLDFGIWIFCLASYVRYRNYSQITRILSVIVLVTIPFFLVISFIRAPVDGSFETVVIGVWRRLRNRIFLSQATSVNYIFTIFPHNRSYFGVEFLMRRVISILPGGSAPSFGEELYNSVFAGSGGFVPPTLVGKLYFSLGRLGLVGLFIWGVLLQTIFIGFVRIQKTPLAVVLFALTSGLLGRSLIQGFLSPVNSIKYVFVLLFPLILVALKLPELRVAVGDKN